ncbi:MAG: nucleotidyltransferase [Clostridiales bacterium]|nr:nucleotidyltransferase [Clostridiales bacterium]
MIYTVDEIRAIMSPIAAIHGVKRVSLFGSYARGEATEDSDVDLLIDRGAIRTAFQMGDLYEELSDALAKELDLVTTKGVGRQFRENIMRDEVLLWDSMDGSDRPTSPSAV